jgi:hypothetical protein
MNFYAPTHCSKLLLVSPLGYDQSGFNLKPLSFLQIKSIASPISFTLSIFISSRAPSSISIFPILDEMLWARSALYKTSACLISNVAQTIPSLPEISKCSLNEISISSSAPSGKSGMVLSLSDFHEIEKSGWRTISPSGLNIPIFLISFNVYGNCASSLERARVMAELFQ